MFTVYNVILYSRRAYYVKRPQTNKGFYFDVHIELVKLYALNVFYK